MEMLGRKFLVFFALLLGYSHAQNMTLALKILEKLSTPTADDTCGKRIFYMLNHFSQDEIIIPAIFNSGKGLNDLGDFEACKSNNQTRYILLEVKGMTFSLVFGICGPRQCKQEDYDDKKPAIAKILTTALKGMGLNVKLTEKELRFTDSAKYLKEEPLYSPGFIIAMIYIGIIVTLTISGTLIASFYRKTNDPIDAKKPTYVRIVCCFDFYQNVTSVFALNKSEEEDLKIFNGMRVLSMAWVVIGHVYFYSKYGFLFNPQDCINEAYVFSKCYLSNAVYAVDVFFVLSGFLSAYLLLKQMIARKGRMPYAHLYIHRFLRLLPLYIAMTVLFCYIIPLLADGPAFRVYFDLVDTDCRKYAWMNFLFVNNFAPLEANCMGWVWYLANDMQFFLITPPLVLIYYKNRRAGILTIASIGIICIGIGIFCSQYFGLSVSIAKYNDNYFRYYYYMPYNRIIPYLVGLLSAYLYTAYKQGNDTLFTRFVLLIKNNVFARWTNYIICAIIIFFLIHAMYWLNNYSKDVSQIVETIYLVFSKPIFAISLFLLILPLMLGHGNALRAFLAHKIFTPFARTTYGTYLVHPMLLLFFFLNAKKGVYYDSKVYHFYFFSYFILSYIISFIMTPIFESPIVSFDRQFLRARRRSTLKGEQQAPQISPSELEKMSLLIQEKAEEGNKDRLKEEKSDTQQ